MQFYAGNFLAADLLFEGGKKGTPHLGACFETHQVPYDYEAQTLRPGQKYFQQTSFTFHKE
jgi:aldose 1-epimerase